jgi:hypothetical protein
MPTVEKTPPNSNLDAVSKPPSPAFRAGVTPSAASLLLELAVLRRVFRVKRDVYHLPLVVKSYPLYREQMSSASFLRSLETGSSEFGSRVYRPAEPPAVPRNDEDKVRE